jgi:hypothetical protein
MVVFFFEQNDRIARALENYFAGKKPILFLEHIDIDFKQDWVGVGQLAQGVYIGKKFEFQFTYFDTVFG